MNPRPLSSNHRVRQDLNWKRRETARGQKKHAISGTYNMGGKAKYCIRQRQECF